MGRRLCILLPGAGVYPALGGMLREVLSDLGWQVTVRSTAEADLLDHDVLFLAGMCRRIDGLSLLLRERRGKKPVTVHWQLEPLPPAELSPAGERLGLRAAAFDWERMPAATRRRLDRVMPFGNNLFRLVRRGLAFPYSRRVRHTPNQEGWAGFYVSNYLVAIGEWRWLKLAHAQGWIDHSFASNQNRVRFLQSRGINAALAPVGGHRGWGQDLNLDRDIDVLYLGAVSRQPRGIKVSRLQEALAQRGRALTLASGVHGEARDRLLNRAKIVLSLLRLPHDLAGMRLLMGMACGALVVSEHCDDTAAFQPGKHFVMAGLDRLPEVIVRYLECEAERQAIAREGHRFVTEELTLEKVVRKMLERVAA
jgi:hypothetical protein